MKTILALAMVLVLLAGLLPAALAEEPAASAVAAPDPSAAGMPPVPADNMNWYDKYEAALEDIKALDAYYSSEEWKQDFADDEAGRLPADLKRGVLSEDGIWNLLSDAKELDNRLKGE